MQEKEETLSTLKTYASRIEGIFSTYSNALKQFGAEPYALSEILSIENFVTWVEGEFSSLGEIFTIAVDNFAMVCCDGFVRFLETEEEALTGCHAGPGFSFSNFEDLAASSSDRVETIRIIFFVTLNCLWP